jgi:hypothetical protein
MKYDFLSEDFLSAMNDIGRYGHEKYGKDSFQHRRISGDVGRGGIPRNAKQVIGDHIRGHISEYQNDIKHDKFGTLKHQLAAVAFNAMMEFYYAGLERETAKTTLPK